MLSGTHTHNLSSVEWGSLHEDRTSKIVKSCFVTHTHIHTLPLREDSLSASFPHIVSPLSGLGGI